MTRKQALCKAITLLDSLEQAPEIAEVIDKLREIHDELPFTRWSTETIHDTLRSFADEHGRNPTLTDLKRKGLPPHTVIKLRFGMTAKEFLHMYYPPASKPFSAPLYGGCCTSEWTEAFIEQFGALKPKSAAEYDRLRREKTPSWQTIAKYNGVKRWNDLLNTLGLAKTSDAPVKLAVTHTIRLGDMYVSDEEFTSGSPSAETIQAAIEGNISFEMKSLEKLAGYTKQEL